MLLGIVYVYCHNDWIVCVKSAFHVGIQYPFLTITAYNYQ